MLRRSWFRLLASIRGESIDRELQEEMDAHLDRDVQRFIAAGDDPVRARERARRQFGNLAGLHESARDSWTFASLDRFRRNVALGLRSLGKRPLFSGVVIGSLALGIGAATTVFSVVNSLLIRPLPYRHANALVAIWPNKFLANREIDRLRRSGHSYVNVASFSPGWLMGLTHVDAPRQVNAAKVSGNFFAMLGVKPLLGGVFDMNAETPGNGSVAVLGEELWESAFHRDPSVVGHTVTLEGNQVTVLGVLPRGFKLLDAGADLWVPMEMDPSERAWTGATTWALAELRPGVTIGAAAAELRQVAASMQRDFEHPASWTAGADVVSLRAQVTGGTTATLILLQVAVVLLLAIAVSNAVNLLVIRTSERHVELAVRTALGASERDLRGLLLVEAALLSLAGALGGSVICVALVGMLRRVLSPATPRLAELSVDWRVVGLTFVVGAGITAVFTLVPARLLRRPALASTIRRGRSAGAGRGVLRGALISVQFALALFLGVGALLMGRTVMALYHVDRGLRSDHLLVMQILPNANGDSARRIFWDEALERVAAIPGVRGAATMLHLPMSGRSWGADVVVDGRAITPGTAAPRTAWQSVSQNLFTMVGLPIISGRGFGPSDRSDVPLVVVVNRAFANAVFPGESPIGRRIRAGFATGNQWATIVGVVGNVPHDSLNVPAAPEVYVPMSQRMVGATTLLVRTTADPLDLAPAVRRELLTIDANTPISGVRTLDDLYSASLIRPRLVLVLLGIFAAAGTVLSAIGIYGMVAYSVRRRLREIGIRAALGAGAATLQWAFVRQGLGQGAVGLVIGLPLAFAAACIARSMLYGVSPFDPVSFGAGALLLVAVAIAASWLPSRRAARVDPVLALKEE